MKNYFAKQISVRISIVITFLVLLFSTEISSGKSSNEGLKVSQMLCDNLVNPIGLDVVKPKFSWQLVSEKRGTLQIAWEIRVVRNSFSAGKDQEQVWNSGKILSDQSVHIPYAGKPLLSAEKYYWRVRVWDNFGRVSAWSDTAFWQMGLLSPADWKAKWIRLTKKEAASLQPSPLFRKEFISQKKIASATAFISSHGLYEAFINNQRIGDAYLTPGWTSYKKRLQYQVYDVTSLLIKGNNAVGITLGSGWYRSRLGWAVNNTKIFGSELGLLFQLLIQYTDGSSELVVSDESWKASTGAIRFSEIYDGELIDARLELVGWTDSEYNDNDWSRVEPFASDYGILTATCNELVRKHETFRAVKIIKTPKGETVVDFGQNLVGFVDLKVSGKAGDTITLHHAEVLDKDGNFYTTNLRTAKQVAKYVLKGSGEEHFQAHFTFYGFRYVKVEGINIELIPENFTAVTIYSDMKPTGSFSCSNVLINQLQHNIQWGQKGNFVDLPTDCPQRDERLGWTGDAQVFSRTAAFNMRVDNFFTKWLQDLAADQLPDGDMPFVIPNVLDPISKGSAGWGDVATIIPWNMFKIYGDTAILERQYKSMKAWVDFIQQQSKADLWKSGFQIGDWLFFRPSDDVDGKSAVTDKHLIAQCFYAHSTQLLINTAQVLGKSVDVAKYTALLSRIKNAFYNEYVTRNGRLVSGTQTAYILALNFDMLPEPERPEAAKRLVNNIMEYDNHLTTGFLGTPYLCDVLTRFGYIDLAYTLLLQETYPSWLYPVKMGATTIWERWDGIKPDGTFQNPDMNSFNHYAYGAIGDWMYRVIAGIDTNEEVPGYKRIKIMPHIGGNLTYAKADLQTYYGDLASHWSVENNRLRMDVQIPCNTMATICIPTDSAKHVKESGMALSDKNSKIKVTGIANGYIIVETGSGKYQFIIE